MLWLESNQCGWLHVVAIIGEVKPESVISLRRRLESLIASGPPTVIIDLSRLKNTSSDLFALLFLGRCNALRRQGELVIAAAQPSVQMAAYAAYTNGNILLFPTVAEALGYLVQPEAQPQLAAQ